MLRLSCIDKWTILVLCPITSHLLCHAWLSGYWHLVCRPCCSDCSSPRLMRCFWNRAFPISCIEILASEHILLLRGFYKASHLTTGSKIRFHAISKWIDTFTSMSWSSSCWLAIKGSFTCNLIRFLNTIALKIISTFLYKWGMVQIKHRAFKCVCCWCMSSTCHSCSSRDLFARSLVHPLHRSVWK